MRFIFEGYATFAIGHFALGYLSGKASSKLSKVKTNLPLLLAVSVLPDIDLIFHFLQHRGPTHSLITFTVLMAPFFLIYRKRAVPYYGVLLSHSLIGDFFTGGVELFWPLSHSWFGVDIGVMSLTNVAIELALFAVTLTLMVGTRDILALLHSGNHNLVLFIAFGAVLGPMLQVGRGYEQFLPSLLIVPSLFYLGLFVYSMSIELWNKLR
ncbi:MAG: metal-dependent hydrolase [Candidatus Bathyarchaeota archaeon]|nr:metal-dependent hydrolase [Candidatus Bathyarchaeota archaeon]